MHVAQQLRTGYFESSAGSTQLSTEEVLGEWHLLDRFGLIVNEAFGGLGASLLLQLAITQYFDCKPERRGEVATYPEFYLFHVGGPHGDFSHFDFWPPRKEVHVPANDPLALLEALNAHGISVIALPEGDAGDLALLESGPSSWAEQGSARDRLRACYTYSATGRVAQADFEIRERAPQTRENITGTIDIMSSVVAIRERVAASGTITSGMMGDADDLRWCEIVETRLHEVSAGAREEALQRIQSCLDETGALTQSYGRISATQALKLIAGLAAD